MLPVTAASPGQCWDLCLAASIAGPRSSVRAPCHTSSCSRCLRGAVAVGQEHLQLAERVQPGGAPARQLLRPWAMPRSTPQLSTCTAQQLRALSHLSASLWGEACSNGLLSAALRPAAQPVGVFMQKGNHSAQRSLHGPHAWGKERAGSQTSALLLPAPAPVTSGGLAQAPRGGQKKGLLCPLRPPAQPFAPHGAKQGCGAPQLLGTRVDRMRQHLTGCSVPGS